jgi:hypothetical protein
MSLELIEIPPQRHDAASGKHDLDPVTAFLQDFGPCQGQLTLVCWGRAWSHYWGAMGGRENPKTLRQFLSSDNTPYVVGKLMLGRDVLLKRAEKGEERWLTQIVDALKDQLRQQSASERRAA